MTQLSIVIPSYNEEANLEWIVDQVIQAARSQGLTHELLIVDDGSSDRTPELAAALAADNPAIRVLTHQTNQGSGQAIRSGIEASRAEFVIYVPADGQFDLDELALYYDAAQQADVVIGARMDRADYTWFRLLSSRVYIQLTNVLFRERFRDVNWVHLWRRSLFNEIVPISHGVYFLDEMLVRASRTGKRIVEVESRYLPRHAGNATGGRISTILYTIYEMGRFWWDLNHNPARTISGMPSRPRQVVGVGSDATHTVC